MNATRLETLLSEIWENVFAILDREPELTGEDAGMIATAAEDAARNAALALPYRLGSRSVEAIAGR